LPPFLNKCSPRTNILLPVHTFVFFYQPHPDFLRHLPTCSTFNIGPSPPFFFLDPFLEPPPYFFFVLFVQAKPCHCCSGLRVTRWHPLYCLYGFFLCPPHLPSHDSLQWIGYQPIRPSVFSIGPGVIFYCYYLLSFLLPQKSYACYLPSCPFFGKPRQRNPGANPALIQRHSWKLCNPFKMTSHHELHNGIIRTF